jgi:serine/threonine protein kinase
MTYVNPASMMIEKSYQVITTLGIGGAGEVYSIRNIKDNAIYAAKFARKDLKVSAQKKLMLLERERDIMDDLQDHPNILKTLHLFQKRRKTEQCKGFDLSKQEFDMHLTTSPFHLLEYCENGSFISYLRNQDALTEDIVAFYTEQLLGCMEYVHYKGYAHLDIKLDNILLDDSFNIRLSDFGSAVKIDDQPFTGFRRGTPKYMAPEVLNLQNGETFDAYKADVYSMGICIYLMLFKRFPVYEDVPYPATKDLLDYPEICQTCPFDCDKTRWAQVSPEIQRILIACLNKDPVDRPSTSELISHFYLPALDETVDERVFEEMQNRRAKYEQSQHESELQQRAFVQPEAPEEPESSEEKEEQAPVPHSQQMKSGSSTYASTNSRN